MATFRATKLVKVTGQTGSVAPVAFDLIDLASPGFCEAINNQGICVELVAIARDHTSGATATGKVTAIAKRLAGTLTVIESGAAAFLGLADLAISGLAVQRTGTKLQALATGTAGTNDWTFHVKLWTD